MVPDMGFTIRSTRSAFGVILRKFHQVGFYESVEVTVHNAAYVRCLPVGAVVLHAAVVEHVAADLRTPFDFFLACFYFCLLCHSVLEFLGIEDRAQLAHGVFLVLGLVAGFGVLDEDFFFLAGVRVGELIPQSHAGLYLVDVLATGASRTEGVPRQKSRFDLDFDGVVHKRGHEYRCKRRHTLALSIVGRHAHEAVNSVLALEESVGKITFYVDGAAFYAGLVPFEQVGDGGFVAVFLGPAQVHAHQHRSPVLALSATGA